ncbi:MAG: inositol monophosphatase [Leptospiraceae bacterium]|nr:inositol monophosphatase [Leptospiraceae bacterium]
MIQPRYDEIEARLQSIHSVLPGLMTLVCEMQKRDLSIDTKSNPMDLVTNADRESERHILGMIQRDFPTDAILAEESGISGAGHESALFQWCVDPIDGTINYAHGLPLFSISIGLIQEGEPVAGVVAMPALGNVYQGVLGRGAFVDGRPLKVRANTDINQSLCVTGFPYDRRERLDPLVSAFRNVLGRVRGVRRTGSAALDLCWLAEGRFDIHYEVSLNAWDACAGAVLVREAGGMLTDFKGNRYVPGMYQMAASNHPEVHKQLLEALRPMADMQA